MRACAVSLRSKRPGTPGGALPLNGFFGLHPSLASSTTRYTARELVVFHAIASPYRERSHFDGQDVLENGTLAAARRANWLAQSCARFTAGRQRQGVGCGAGPEYSARHARPASVTSWSPSKLAALDDDTLERITDLYAGDPLLACRLADALAADAIAEYAANAAGDLATARRDATALPRLRTAPTMAPPSTDACRYDANSTPCKSTAAATRGKPMRYTEVVRAAAGFLRRDDGPQVAVFDTTGWDTHANEGNAEGQLAGRLAALDAGLRTLKDELGPAWADTAVLLATEFGRTAATNGTRGTDHGTATAAFLLGGAVQGGRVLADWPGLSSHALYQGRDLKPTADLRSVLKGVLSEHLLVSSQRAGDPPSSPAAPTPDPSKACSAPEAECLGYLGDQESSSFLSGGGFGVDSDVVGDGGVVASCRDDGCLWSVAECRRFRPGA